MGMKHHCKSYSGNEGCRTWWLNSPTHSAVLAELKPRNVVRTGNNPTGDYVEWLVSSRLGLTTLEANSEPGFDALGPDEKGYQIKGRRLNTDKGPAQLGVLRDLRAVQFDFLIAVVMNADWSVRYAAKIPHAALESMATFLKHVNGHVLCMTPSVLQLGSGRRFRCFELRRHRV